VAVGAWRIFARFLEKALLPRLRLSQVQITELSGLVAGELLSDRFRVLTYDGSGLKDVTSIRGCPIPKPKKVTGNLQNNRGVNGGLLIMF